MRHNLLCSSVFMCLMGLFIAIQPNAAYSQTCTTTAECDDGNPCTDDWCDPGVEECFYTNNTDSCDDGDACTENDTCSAGVCAGTAIDCDDADPCTTDSCVDGTCQHDSAGCACTEDTDCDDGNACTNDICDPGLFECVYTNNTDSCDDGDACTENDACSNGACAGTALNCDDGIACTQDSCANGTCVNDTSACECTTTADCDDGNPCTDDWCDPAVYECFYTNNTDPCDDGDTCTENDTCNEGICSGTDTCANATSTCAPASGATTLMTCFALLALRLCTRSQNTLKRRAS